MLWMGVLERSLVQGGLVEGLGMEGGMGRGRDRGDVLGFKLVWED
jgi:hypothetical protein